MNAIPSMEIILKGLLTVSIQVTVLVLLVLAVQWLFRRRLSAGWRFALWWLVLLRLLMPVAPQSPFSLFNLFRPSLEINGPPELTKFGPATPISSFGTASPLDSPASVPTIDPSLELNRYSSKAVEETSKSVTTPMAASIEAWTTQSAVDSDNATPATPAKAPIGLMLVLLTTVWATGALTLFGAGIAQSIRFQSRLRKSRWRRLTEWEKLLNQCRASLRIRREVELAESSAVQSPVICGLVRLRLLLPPDMSQGFSADELRHVILHELAHVKRRDLWLNWLLTLLQAVHWFNPFIWIAFRRLRADRELACDEIVLNHAGDAASREYGQTIIKLLEGLPRSASTPGMAGILEDANQMKQRIRMIVKFKQASRWSSLAAVLILALGLVGLTDAQTGRSDGQSPGESIQEGTLEQLTRGESDFHTLTTNGLLTDGTNTIKLHGARPASAPDLLGGVQDENAHPLDATVFISTAGPKRGTSTFCPSCYADCRKSAQTDAGGNFKIESLDSKLIFRILAVARGYQPKFVSKVDPASGPVTIKLERTERNEAQPECSLHGRVVNKEDSPVIGAVVEAHGIHTTGGGGRWGSLPGVDPLAVTDERGEFLITSEDPFESMDVKVEARGFARKTFMQLASGTTIHVLKLTEGAAVTGRVVRDGLEFTDVSVGLVSVDRGTENFTGNFEIGTDADGRFALVNLPANVDYYLYGLMNSLKPFGAIPVMKIHTGPDGDTLDVGDLNIVPSHRLAGRVALADGAGVPAETRLLISRQSAWDSMSVELDESGHFDVTGLPAESYSLSVRVPGYRVSAHNPSLDPLNPYMLVGRVDRDVTNLVFLLEKGQNLEPNYNYSSSVPESEWPNNRLLRGSEAKPDTSNQFLVSGRVVDAETGAPVANFRVTPGRLPHPMRQDFTWDDFQAVEGRNGKYSAYIDRRWAQPQLKVEAEGYLPVVSATLRPEDQNDADFALHKGAGPSGIVRLPNGEPAADAGVALICAGGSRITLNANAPITTWPVQNRSITSGPDGRFSFDPELDMKSVIAANAKGFKWMLLKELEASPEMKLEPWGRIEGVLLRPSGPGTNEDLDLTFAEAQLPGQPKPSIQNHTLTDAAGHFAFDNVPPGKLDITYRVPVGNNGWQNHKLQEAAVEPGQTLKVTINAPERAASDMLPNAAANPKPPRKRTGELKGIVLLPDGKPASEAEVALLGAGEYISLGRAALSGLTARRAGLIVRTGPDGKFILPLYEKAGPILAVHMRGFARVPLESLQDSPEINLQAWGQIAGILRIGRRPGTNELVMLTSSGSDLQPPMFSPDEYQFKTDDQGRFFIPFVPPGNLQVAHLVPEGGGAWRHSNPTPVTVEPGQTTTMQVGGSGLPVTGTVSIENPPGEVNWADVQGALHTPYPALMKQFRQLKTPEEQRAFSESEAFREAMGKLRYYHLAFSDGGKFSAEEIPPGEYELSLYIRRKSDVPPENLPIEVRRKIVIPGIPGDDIDASVKLGTIEVEVPPTRR